MGTIPAETKANRDTNAYDDRLFEAGSETKKVATGRCPVATSEHSWRGKALPRTPHGARGTGRYLCSFLHAMTGVVSKRARPPLSHAP